MKRYGSNNDNFEIILFLKFDKYVKYDSYERMNEWIHVKEM